MTELERHHCHSEWLAFQKSQKKDGPEPPPGYKDCLNCQLRDDYETTEEKAEFCESSCPFDDPKEYPPSPSVHFIKCALWAKLPDVFLAKYAEKIGLRTCMDVHEMKQYREDRKMASMMGASLLG